MEYWWSGEEKIITFTQEMNIQGGQYLLSLGCTTVLLATLRMKA